MNIIVSGCGKIGTAIISTLVGEGHDVTALDNSPEIINEITNIYDAIGICGNATDCETLTEAGVQKADLFISVTGSDELNMLSCFLAKRMGAKHTIARIRNPEYNDHSLGFMKQELNISMAINPEQLMAQELYNILKLPSAFKVEYFARRNLEMIELRLKEDSPLCGKKLSKLREKQKTDFLIGAIFRQGKVIIPDGSFELQVGDVISIAAAPSDMQKLLKSFGILKKQARNVMILGGSKTAFYLAKQLLAGGNDVRIIEKDHAKCESLSEHLPGAVMIHGDGSQQELLLEEGLRSLDAFVALTGMDEENILISIFASSQNVPQVISKINRSEMVAMAEKLGLDCIVSTKSVTSDIVLRYTRALENSRGSSIETLYKLMDGKAEAVEFKVGADSPVASSPIKDLKIKPGILIAGIIRPGKKAVIPTGDDIIAEGDRVIVLAAEHRLSALKDIIR
ncbi:MAG: Trk system potassium transporter TrkA [Clostridia bacterium]|nr:Trk system potassium transporter TrkA [Clostridia bacterium]